MNKKIGFGFIGLTLLLAGLADLLSLIPFVGILTGTVFWIIMSVFLWMKGYGFVNARRLVTGGISMVLEWIPAVQELPITLLGAVILIFILKTEEKTGIKLPIGGKGVSGASKKPLNHGGVRMPRQGGMSDDNA